MTLTVGDVSLGLIGPGAWGENYIHTIDTMRGVHLAATASYDWAEMIARGGLDGVIVATPPATHADIAIAAIEAGLPVLIEKPLALSVADAKRIATSAAQHGGRVLVDHIHLFQPAWPILKQRAKALGKLRSIRGVAGDHGPFRDDASVLWDWGPHDVALCLDLMEQDPSSATAKCLKRVTTQEGVGELVTISLKFDHGAEATIEIGNLTIPRQRYFKATFEHGTLVLDSLVNRKLVFWGASGATESIDVPTTPALTVAVEQFTKMIAAPGPALDSLDLAVRVIETLDTCQRSLGT